MTKADRRVESTPIPNVALIRAMDAKGLSARRLARQIGVVERTVIRWRDDLYNDVHEDNAGRAAEALDGTPHDFWPHPFSPPAHSKPSTAQRAGTFNPTTYASRRPDAATR